MREAVEREQLALSTASRSGAPVPAVYETLEGWSTAITGVTERQALPAKATAYLDRIAETVGAPVGMIGVGPERAATLL